MQHHSRSTRRAPLQKRLRLTEYRKHKHLFSSSKALAELTPRQHSGTGFPPKSSHRHKNRPSCHRIRPKVEASWKVLMLIGINIPKSITTGRVYSINSHQLSPF